MSAAAAASGASAEEVRRRALVGIVVGVVVGALMGAAGSAGSVDVAGLPVFGVCAALAFVVNWVGFVPAYRAQTERFYDITGTATYLTMTLFALAVSGDLDLRAILAGLMVLTWALRLGIFLFRRIKADGGDGRFDEIKTDLVRFGVAWTLQGLWCLMTVAAALAIITTQDREPMGVIGWAGFAVFCIGLAIEATADQQKRAHRAEHGRGTFIDTGLWAWSQHPNYFGEITLWTGMAIMAVPVLSGPRFAVLLSPVFVYVLLTRISGIPMLRARTKERFGDDPEWQAYDEATPLLLPKPPG